MLQSIQRYIYRFIDPASLLAVITALFLIGLFGFVQELILLGAAVVYALLAAYGIYRYQTHGTPIVNRQMRYESEALLEHTLPPESARTITTRMGVTVDGLVRATSAINEVTAQQSNSAQEQAKVITDANKMLDAFLTLSDHINEQTRSVTRTAQTAAEISERGQEAIVQSIHSMADIRQQVEAIGETIVTLAKFTRRIDEIITSVSEIATQSNLLALNASIEAARAGVHGRGFAVVADEVRTLAQQSTQSAAQVRDILGEIQKAMKETINATQLGIENVDVGASRTREANDVMVTLSESVRNSREAVNDIYQVIRQQAKGLEEIAISMDRIQQITQQSLASTRTVETVSTNLTRLANDLQQVVNDPIFQDFDTTAEDTAQLEVQTGTS